MIIRESGSCGRSTPGSGNGLSKGPVVTACMALPRSSSRLVWLEHNEHARKEAQARMNTGQTLPLAFVLKLVGEPWQVFGHRNAVL